MIAPSRILLTTDFSAAAERAYGPAAELARRLGARITLVHVLQELAMASHGPRQAPRLTAIEAEKLLETTRRQLAEASRKVPAAQPAEWEVLEGADVAESVAAYANKVGAEFVAIATHGRTGIRRLVLGSTAESVLRHSSVPVVVFPVH
jgi:nucleotide-binding universal stress UspA family protein